MAENLVFLIWHVICIVGFLLFCEKKALRAGFRFDMVRTLNRNHRFLFFILSLSDLRTGVKSPFFFYG